MKTLDLKETEEFIRLHAQLAAVDQKRMDELKKKILQDLAGGAVSPPELPFLLVNIPQNRKQPDWKGYALGLLTKLYKRSKDSETKAKAELASVDAAWPKLEVPALHVEENPVLAAQLGTPA